MPLPVYGTSPTTEPKVPTGGTGGGLPEYKAGAVSVPPAVGSKPSPAVEKAVGSIPTPTVQNDPIIGLPTLPKEEKTGFAKYYDSYKGMVASFANDFATTLTDTVVGLPRNLAIYGTKAVQSIENAYANRKSLADPDYLIREKVNKSARDPFYQDIIDELGKGKFDEKNWDTKIQNKVKEVYRNIEIGQGVDPENRTFAQNLSGGAGSVGAFFVPSTAIAKTFSGIAKTEKAAKIYSATGNLSLTLSEAMMEGDQVFRTEYQKTGNVQDAQAKADRTVAANIAVLGITNKFSKYFEATAPGIRNLIKTTLVSGVSEGSQEGIQQIISNVNTGRPIFEGVKDSALIGSILGSGTHLATRPMTEGSSVDPAQLQEFKNKIIEENKDNPVVKDFVKYDSVREEVFKYIESTRKVESRTEIVAKLEEAGIPQEIAVDMVSKADLAPVSQETVQEEIARFKVLHPEKPSVRLPEYVPKSRIKDEEKIVIEGIDPKNETRLTPEQAAPIADKVATTYWDKKIAMDLKDGRPVVIGGDDLKDFFGKDYNDNNHPIYSQAAGKLLERALQESKDKTVVFTGGGPASGKSELVVNGLSEGGHKGVIYDSNFSNYEGAVKQIQMARDAGKDIEIHGVIPNLEKSRVFSLMREEETGRGISDATFARGHSGFPSVVLKLLENGIVQPSEVFLLDTRDIDTKEKFEKFIKEGKYVADPLEITRKLGYSEEDIKKTYAKENYTKAEDKYIQKSELQKEPSKSSRKDRATSKGISRLNERLQGKLEQEMQGDVLYDKITFADETAKALALYESDPQLAIDIATGKVEPPRDILYQAISLVVREKELEKKNFKAYKDALVKASQRGSRTGQEISYLQTAFDETSPDSFIRQVLQIRRQLAESNYKPMFDKIKKRFGAGKDESVVEERLAKARKNSGKSLKQVLEFKAQSIDAFLEEMKC